VEILGIDIGGSGIKGAPVHVATGRLATERFRIPTPDPATPESVATVVEKIRSHFDYHGVIGCTVPARVTHGLVRTAANIHKMWLNTPVDRLFRDATGCRVLTLNDADAAGLASMRFGAGQNRDGLVIFLTVGTGIGSAMFFDQKLIPNTELGHIHMKGGAAELYVSDRTRKNEDLTWKQWARRFQKYLDRIEFLFAPDTIIIGGGVSRPQKISAFWEYLETDADLVAEELQNEAGIIGAALTAEPES
jgi:polyphosphate glucokinase